MRQKNLILSMTLIAFVTPLEAAETESPTPSPISIEGARIGMSLDDLKAIPGIKVKERSAFVPENLAGRLYKVVSESGRHMEIRLDAERRVYYIEAWFMKMGGLGGATPEMPFETLVTVLTERWGPPVSNATTDTPLNNAMGAVIATEHTQTAVWNIGNVRATVLFDTPIRHFSFAEGAYPKYILTITRPLTPAEEATAAAADAEALKDAREKVKP